MFRRAAFCYYMTSLKTEFEFVSDIKRWQMNFDSDWKYDIIEIGTGRGGGKWMTWNYRKG